MLTAVWDQIAGNAVIICFLLLTSAIFLSALGWASIQFMRMAQIAIMTNAVLARELSVANKSFAPDAAAPSLNIVKPAKTDDMAHDPVRGKGKPHDEEGEFYAYDERLQADLETVRSLRKEQEIQQGLSDDELDAHIASVKDAGFDEDEP